MTLIKLFSYSSLNKDDSSATTENHFFNFLESLFEDDKNLKIIFCSVLRCFENCETARNAVKRHRGKLLKHYDSKFLTQNDSMHVSQVDSKFPTKSKVVLESSADLANFVRSLLLLQSLDKREQTGLTSKVLGLFCLDELTSDSRSQLSIFIINEMKAKEEKDWISQVKFFNKRLLIKYFKLSA